ncbi:deoxyribodipyrimidine photolyase [Fimbriiglobus ruber]|uniref:Deoxyribodipyrimidine photo-lyase n=1 Tax=Fimbriiglobus ruber TaxID=1908690 RepID=A0A225DFF9_9BACT|nr:deoxyribodipyrimidine photolyase [Fimbriiglobus ruber]OWK35125.1 Deoxyribodipyrimidine photolyase, type II [Fimbriiglobus ruber]
MPSINEARVRAANDRPVNEAGDYVLYWCQMFRRLHANHALDHALHWSRRLKKPLVVYEGLKLNYPWACARFHQFMLEGMRDNAAAAQHLGVAYWPFVETPGDTGRGLVRKLCEKACLLVTDDYPQFIVPAQIRAVAAAVAIAVHAIDGNGTVPLSKLGPPTAAAAHLRPKLHKLFPEAWSHKAAVELDVPKVAKSKLDSPFASWEAPKDIAMFVKKLPIDHTVPAVPDVEGGSRAAAGAVKAFVDDKLSRYADGRNQPDDPAENAASGLSFYLRHGHVGIEEVCAAVLEATGKWTAAEINPATRNKDDFFCRDANVNSFLDEAITWRDVGYQWNFARNVALSTQKPSHSHKSWQADRDKHPLFNFQHYDFSPQSSSGTLDAVLPEWAKASLAKHARDRRPFLYTLEQFESADTHDDLWNAAQRELVATGRIHNYLRMLWGKKVLEWSETPEEAYRVLEHLNNKYALDGRDPNSYTGILWCFGLFDRPWPPERNVFGSVRYMTSESTAKKFKLQGYYDYTSRLSTVADVRAGKIAAPRPAGLF